MSTKPGQLHNARFHNHLVVLGGTFSEAGDGSVRFHEASELTSENWHALQRTVQRRVLRDHASRGALPRHNLLDEHATADMLT